MTAQSSNNQTPDNSNLDNPKIISKLLLLVVAMFGFGFALVPLYDVFCDVTGLNGKTGDKVNFVTAPIVDESRLIKITFLASLNESMPWEFKPQQSFIEVHPGQPTTITYIAKNISSKSIVGSAVPSVVPGLAAAYFQKTECFCFTQQELKAGEEKIMPVTFIVDSELSKDINEIALSYTFFISKQNNQDLTEVVKDKNSEAKSSTLSLNQDHIL